MRLPWNRQDLLPSPEFNELANPYRGEIDASIGGKSYRLCLTLGALAELENAYGEEDMAAIAERFQSGRLKASDAIRIIGAGLRGAGYVVSDKDVAAMPTDGGAAGFVDIVARLLRATFSTFSAAQNPDQVTPDGS
jgi:Phage tail tube protein, GTA-gp10